jgi:hypothetical protein
MLSLSFQTFVTFDFSLLFNLQTGKKVVKFDNKNVSDLSIIYFSESTQIFPWEKCYFQ